MMNASEAKEILKPSFRNHEFLDQSFDLRRYQGRLLVDEIVDPPYELIRVIDSLSSEDIALHQHAAGLMPDVIPRNTKEIDLSSKDKPLKQINGYYVIQGEGGK